MYRNFLIVVISVFVLLSACASAKGPLFQQAAVQDPSYSLLYVYRPQATCLKKKRFDFLIGDRHIVSLKNNEYSFVQVRPGEHIIVSGGIRSESIPSLKIKISTEKGKHSFVKYELICKENLVGFVQSIEFKLGAVGEKTALKEISKTHRTLIPNEVIK